MNITKIEFFENSGFNITDEKNDITGINVPVYKVTYNKLFKKNNTVIAAPNGKIQHDFISGLYQRFFIFVNKEDGKILPVKMSQQLTNYFYANQI